MNACVHNLSRKIQEESTPDRGRMPPFTNAGERSVAVRDADAGRLAAAWGGLEGFTPPHNLRRGQRLPTDSVHSPAPARQRKAQVCGDSTVQSDGRRAGSPHPPQVVPLPLDVYPLFWTFLF